MARRLGDVVRGDLVDLEPHLNGWIVSAHRHRGDKLRSAGRLARAVAAEDDRDHIAEVLDGAALAGARLSSVP